MNCVPLSDELRDQWYSINERFVCVCEPALVASIEGRS